MSGAGVSGDGDCIGELRGSINRRAWEALAAKIGAGAGHQEMVIWPMRRVKTTSPIGDSVK